MTYANLVNILKELGYKPDRRLDCKTPQYISLYIVEIDTGIGFANIRARRDLNFEKLREFRRRDLKCTLKGKHIYI